MKLRWFLSGTVREATEMSKQVSKVLSAQRDILSAQALETVTAAHRALQEAIDSDAGEEALRKRMEEMEQAAGKHFKPYPNPGWRENIEVMLVAIAVAMAIRTFFLQPFKIPTGSMQPTLYGITVTDLRKADADIPGFFTRFGHGVFYGTFYQHLTAEADGQFEGYGPPEKFLRFFNRQTVIVSYLMDGRPTTQTRRLWFTPEDGLAPHVPLKKGQPFQQGDDLIKVKEIRGDHLFVDRLSYNFRRPKRGEIIVFQTEGISGLAEDLFYIKRLVALGGERVRIGADRHVRIDEVRLDASTPRFEFIYTFEGNPRPDHYSGHVGGPRLPTANAEFPVRPDHYFVLGDNTMNSSDSRYWGDFPKENVIGKSFFVYWPISERFGWGHR